MAIDANAKLLINTLKLSRKKYETLEQKYTKKFILGKAIPTEEDVENFEELIRQMKVAAGKMHKDVEEISATIRTFGGPSDTVIGSAETALKTLKSKLPD